MKDKVLSKVEELKNNCEKMFQFFLIYQNDNFKKEVLVELKKILIVDKSYKFKIIKKLEEKYQSKSRDLSKLHILFKNVKYLIPNLDINYTSAEISLLWTAIELQDANHGGDPHRIDKAVSNYESNRINLLNDDFELVTYIDLNVVVHYNDKFDFDTALNVNSSILLDSNFENLSFVMKGMVKSSLGQSYSINRNYEKAEKCFVEAIELFNISEIDEIDKLGEIDQTKCYRALNAIDGGFTNRISIVEDTIGDLNECLELFKNSNDIKTQYHHHIFLRTLFFCDEVNPEIISEYTSYYKNWSEQIQHPWELINLYRGVFCWQRTEDIFMNYSLERFKNSIKMIKINDFGATLKLIGSVISTVAFACFDDNYFLDDARYLLKETEDKLKYSVPQMEKLRTFINNKCLPENIKEIIEILPFNYH